MMRYEVRELDVGGVLDRAINLTKDNFWLFFKITLALFLPVTLIGGLIVLWTMPQLPAAPRPDMLAAHKMDMPLAPLMGIAVIGLINAFIVFPLSKAAIIHAVASTYLDKPISVGLAFRRAIGVLFPLLGTWILTGLVVMIGFLLCIVPGIIFAFWFLFVPEIVVIEGISGTAAMKRSRELMKGNMGTAFVLGILIFIIGFAIGVVPNFIPQAEVATIVRAVLQAGLFIFGAAAWIVFYFSCRCKAENFDLAMLADAVGAEAPPAGI